MTETVKQLTDIIGSTAHHEPLDHTILGALADALDESHPQGQDGRATFIRKWLAAPLEAKTHWANFRTQSQVNYEDRQSDRMPFGARLAHGFQHREHSENKPFFRMVFMSEAGPFRRMGLSLDHAEARDLADVLPNAKASHNYLDDHHGPDPRPTQHTDSNYSDHYRRAIQ